jgi:hypothetical protein
LWFWSCKVATRALDSPHCFQIWRHIRVCKAKTYFFFLLFLFNIYLTVWSYYFNLCLSQLSCSGILDAWNSRRKNWCFCLRCAAVGTSHGTASSGLLAAKPCVVGMIFIYLFLLVCRQVLGKNNYSNVLRGC